MKVLLLNGSANKNGNTFTALSEIARQLEKRRFTPMVIPIILNAKCGKA